MNQDAAFGRLLRRLRKARDLTQEALAQQAYCAVDTIKKIEAGVRRPSRQLAAQFADCLGLAGDERAAFLAAARPPASTEVPLPPRQAAPEGGQRPSGTVTFLFTDIEGSTRLWEHSPDQMPAAFQRQEAILRQAIASHAGYAYKMVGDAFQAAFATAAAALAAAVAAQRTLASAAWGPIGPLRVRMALDSGVVEERGDDYVGPLLNRTARLLAAGHGGQILLSAATYELVRTQLPANVTLRELGMHQLKDLIRPERVYQAVAPDLPSDFPPLKTDPPPAAPPRLPPQPTSFVGRAAELAELGRMLADPSIRLVTIIGPGGTGKTRLALEIAARTQHRVADGVGFVPLAPVDSPDHVVAAIAAALRLPEHSSDPRLQLLDYLRRRETLLVLDNFEHLLAEVVLIGDLLQTAPGVKLLVTSRERLNLIEEWVLDLRGLAFPEERDHPDPAHYSAMRLFLQRIAQHQSGAPLAPEELGEVARVCRLVQGLPLALELAAGWVRSMSLAEISAEIRLNLDFLATNLRNLPERHRSLRAVFDHSWALLDAQEQRVLARLAVFRGGFAREAAREVAGATVAILSALADKSLLSHSHAGRHTIHELLRQYAEERLRSDPAEEAAARQAHAQYFAGFLHTREADLRGGRQSEALDEIAAEVDNVRTAWQWAVDHDDLACLQRALDSLHSFYEMRGMAVEGIAAFGRAIEKLSAGTAGETTSERALTLGRLLVRQSWLLARADLPGDLETEQRGIALLEASEQDTRTERAEALGDLGTLQYFAGDPEQAIASITAALALATAAGANDLVAHLLNNHAQMLEFQGEARAAAEQFRASLALFEKTGELRDRSFALNNWGRAAYAMGDYPQARRLIEDALRIRQRFNDRYGIAYSLLDLGRLAEFAGDYAQARELIGQSLAIVEQTHAGDQAARAYVALGAIAHAEGDLDQAENHFQRALRFWRDHETARGPSLCLNGLAHVALDRGDSARARAYLDESLAIAQQLRNVGEAAVAELGLGRVALASGAPSRAAAYLRRALQTAERTGAAPLALDALIVVAQLESSAASPRIGRAIELLALATAHPAARHATRAWAGRLLDDLTSSVAPATVEEVRGRGTRLDLWQTVAAVLRELDTLEAEHQHATGEDEPEATRAPKPMSSLAQHPKAIKNLPPQPTPFIGRARELADLARLLGDAQVRLVTITGPGGIGKTRLAIALAEQLLTVDRFPDRVFFVPLAPIETADRIVPALAEALDFPLDSGKQQVRSPQQQVFDYLRARRLMLVFDNVEHLLGDAEAGAGDAADLVAALLTAAPGVVIVATSRERLKLREEHVYPLGGLDVPGAEAPSTYGAVALFVQRAQLLRPDFDPETDDLSVVARICRLVEGMPLAIELAAGWVDTLTLPNIAAEIERGLDLLASELRDVPARHRSMRAVFDASWRRMGAAEGAVFARLAVFRGGGTRRAVQAVTRATLPQLHALVGASLVHYDATRDRYTIHELLRQYAAEQLAAEPEDQRATRDRHAAYFCALLGDLRADLQGARQQEALAAIEADGENVRAAWEWAAGQPNAALIDQAMDSLGYFYEWQGRAEEGAAAYRLAVAALVAASTPDAQRMRAKLLAWQSRYMSMLGDNTAAGALLAQSQDLLNGSNLADADTRAERAFVLLQAGRLATDHEYPAARAAYGQSRALFQALGDRWGEAAALFGLGNATHDVAGDEDLAERWLKESLALRRALGDRLGIVETLAKLSETTRYLGRVAESEQLARESYALSTALGNRRTIALAASNLGSALNWKGQFAESHRLLEEAVAIYTDLVDRAGLALAYLRRGFAETSLGRYTDARTTFAHQLQIARALGSPMDIGSGLTGLTGVALAEGSYTEARALLAEAVPLFMSAGERWYLTFTHSLRALAERGASNRPQARRHAVRALRTTLEIRSWLLTLNTLCAIALLLADDAEPERAAELYALIEREGANTVARRELAEIAAALPADVAAAAQTRGRARDLWATARELLAELEAAGWGSGEAEI